MMNGKRLYPTFHIAIGGYPYSVDCRVELPRSAPRVGADSPRFMAPGSPLRVRVLRIRRDGYDVTDELIPITLSKIEQAVRREVATRLGRGSVQGPELSCTSFPPASSFSQQETRAVDTGRRILDSGEPTARVLELAGIVS